MNRRILIAALIVGVCLLASLGLRTNTQSHASKKHLLRVDVTGVSGIFPADPSKMEVHTVVFPDATMPRLSRRVCPGDRDYIVPAHYSYVRVPMQNVVLGKSRQPDFIIGSDSLKYEGDGGILIQDEKSALPPAVPTKKYRIGIWLIGLEYPEKLTLPALTPSPKSGDLANVAVFTKICSNPDLAQKYLPGAKDHVGSIFVLPKAFLATSNVNDGNLWVFDPPREDGAPSGPAPLSQSVYSAWEVTGNVTLSTSPLGPVTGPGPVPTPLIVLTAAKSDIFVRTGDVPLDDLLEVKKKETMNVDTHFELYYLMTNADMFIPFPSGPVVVSSDHLGTIHVPRLSGGPKMFYYPRGHNCPPGVFKDALQTAAVSEEEGRRLSTVAAIPTPCPTPRMGH
jgi:hypothetical protein